VRAWDELLSSLRAGSGPPCVVVLCGATPGNLGAVLRNCALLGVAAVCVLEALSGADVVRALRTSQLARRPHWDVSLVVAPEGLAPAVAVGQLRDSGLTTVGLAAAASACADSSPVWEAELAGPGLALVFGADRDDGEAFPEGVAQLIDVLVTVPMSSADVADTLNVSHTVSIVAYERQRQQGALVRAPVLQQPPWRQKFPSGACVRRRLLSLLRGMVRWS